jgi:hypothetical protein
MHVSIEEVGCQACVLLKKRVFSPMFLKKRVVRPVFVEEVGCQAREHSLQVRELLGIAFPRCQLQLQGSETSLFDLLLKPWKGSGAVEGLLRREGAHFLGWDRHVGNEGL